MTMTITFLLQPLCADQDVESTGYISIPTMINRLQVCKLTNNYNIDILYVICGTRTVILL